MAVTDPCKAREPKVIDNALIEKCIDYQYPKGEIGRLMRQEGIPMEEIQEIRFEFMNILKIDHLWVLKSLTKLQLNNNCIEKIENLNTLINLRELDLSFNKISKMENLDELIHLEKLSFYENLLFKIENIDPLLKLTIFSVGKNKISDWEDIHYLRKFTKLTSLNMAHNPCAEKDNFRTYVAALLPQVVYYEYSRIENSERDTGLVMFAEKLKALKELEDAEHAKAALSEKEKENIELHSASFVENLNSRYLFDLMYEGDSDGKAFLDMGVEMHDFYLEYEEQFVDLCYELFKVGQKHYKIRTEEIGLFVKTVDQAKLENQNESIGYMETFLQQKIDIFDQVQILQAHLDNDIIDEEKYIEKIVHYTNIFNDMIHDTWKKLMKLELQLFEQIEDVNQNFEHVLADMINTFLEESQAIFTQIRGSEVAYTETLSDIASRFLTSANLNEKMFIPKCLRNIMIDKETVNNAIATTHDVHLLIIDNREDTLVGNAKQWLESFTKNLQKEEIKRNRYKLLEINHFLDIQREEFEDLTVDKTVADLEDMDNF